MLLTRSLGRITRLSLVARLCIATVVIAGLFITMNVATAATSSTPSFSAAFIRQGTSTTISGGSISTNITGSTGNWRASVSFSVPAGYTFAGFNCSSGSSDVSSSTYIHLVGVTASSSWCAIWVNGAAPTTTTTAAATTTTKPSSAGFNATFGVVNSQSMIVQVGEYFVLAGRITNTTGATLRNLNFAILDNRGNSYPVVSNVTIANNATSYYDTIVIIPNVPNGTVLKYGALIWATNSSGKQITANVTVGTVDNLITRYVGSVPSSTGATTLPPYTFPTTATTFPCVKGVDPRNPRACTTTTSSSTTSSSTTSSTTTTFLPD